MPGQHVVHVQFTPTPDKDYVIDEVLTAEFKTIPASDVVCKFMNVRTEKGYQMLFHHMNDRGDTTLLSRVQDLDKTSTLSVVPKNFDKPTHDQEYWVTFNKGSLQYLSQHSAVSGAVLRQSVVEGNK